MPSGERGPSVLVSFNPHAGARDPRKRRRVDELCAELAVRGLATHLISDRGELASQAGEEHRRGLLRAVVAAGGDGTAADLVNRLEPTIPIALFPLGTENLLARYLGVTSDPRAAAETIAHGAAMALDAGSANGRLFLLMAGCGFDGEVVRRLHAARSGHISHWSYAKPILAAIRNYQYPQFEVHCRLSSTQHETPIEHSFTARWAFVSNLPCYAGRLCFSPLADADDGRLDICAFQGGSVWAGLRYLFGVFTGRHENMIDCVTARATRVRLEAGDPVPYQLDGDPGGCLPLTIEVLARRMTVLVSRDAGGHRQIDVGTDTMYGQRS
jgi:diacylglycerol kinase family enzyme